MSGRGPGGGRGPGDGYFGPGFDGPGTPSPGSNSGSSNLPVWALVLIMVGSGLITLTFLWLCVLFICRKRRARRAAVRDDLEVQTGSFQSERETARILGINHNKEEDAAKRCESEAGVELTFVVMAGEDQPSYLAKPAPQQQQVTMNDLTTTAGDAAARTAPEANSQLEKQSQQQRSAASGTPPPRVVKTPPSPS